MATLLIPWGFNPYPMILEAENVSGILIFSSLLLLLLLHERSGGDGKKNSCLDPGAAVYSERHVVESGE